MPGMLGIRRYPIYMREGVLYVVKVEAGVKREDCTI